MIRRSLLALSMFSVVVAVVLPWAGAPSATAATSTTTLTTPASYVLVDNDTGKVLSAANEHADLPPASITKLLTALVAVEQLPADKKIPITADAAAMPAMKIGVLSGQMWSRDDLLHSLLMVSANDAAVALADAAGGGLNGFAAKRYEAARELGLADNPTLNDPAGLDDSTFSNDGGDRVSARDMAIVARAALAQPLIKQIVAEQTYKFVGPDGTNHTLTNHNKMLAQYAGAIGMKTGYTAKAKNTFVGAAERDGRTMLVVVMGADNPYNYAETLLNQGFATPVKNEPIQADVLPAHALSDVSKPAVVPKTVAHAAPTSHHVLAVGATVGLILVLGLATLAIRFRDAATQVAIVKNDRFINPVD